MATCGNVLLFVRGVGSGDASYLLEVKCQGLVVSVFRGVGGVYFRVVSGCI